MAALAAIPPPVVAQANRDRASRHLAKVAGAVARSHGHADLGSFVLARIEQGASLATISREAGLNKDWLSRHLAGLDRVLAEAVRRRLPNRPDARWLPVLTRLGFPDVPTYLWERHISQHRTVNAIAAEAGQTHHAVEAALRRHGLARTAHAAKRHQAHQRAAQVAARLGFDSMTDYVASRRGGRMDLAGDGGRMRPASVVVAAAGAGHVPARTALIFAKRSPALTAARTVTRLAWPASRCAGVPAIT
jgi:hypothetical protein